MPKHILVVSQYYYPEQFRINDMCEEWVKRGYKVTVLTGIPNYPQGKFYDGYGLFKKRKESYNGADIIRIPLIARGHNSIGMVLNYFSFVLSGWFWSKTTKLKAMLISVFVIGTFHGLKGMPDLWAYALYFVQTILISFVLYLIQLLLSFAFYNQAISLCVGLTGGLIGLFIMLLPRSFFYEIIPWGLFGANMFVGMNWDSVTRDMDFYYTTPIDGAFLWVFLWIVFLLLAGWLLFQKRPIEGFSFHSKATKSHSSKAIRNLRLPIEYAKLKGSPIWIAFVILPLISALIGTFNYQGNVAVLNDLWYSLWSQHTLFLCYFFMPALLGVYCSYLWRLEHTGTNWNQLMVHISPWKLVRDKLFCAMSVLGLSLLWISALFLLCGKMAGFTESAPSELIEWLLCGFLGGICICCIQLFFSLVIRSFSIPIAMALMGSIAGLMLTSHGLWYLLPYSLFSIGMRANNPFFQLDYGVFFLFCICFCGGFYLLSVFYLKHTDVRTMN